MKATKIFITLLSIFVISGCTQDDDIDISEFDLEPFVRFNFLVNNNNIPLEYPAVSTVTRPISEFSKNSISILKIPVTLSSPALSSGVTVDYSLETELDPGMYEITPAQLSFNGTQLTDTLYVDFKERWEPGDILKFKLTDVSDSSISIGNPNTTYPNDEFSVKLEAITTTYSLQENRIEIEGTAGEEKEFTLVFPNGYFSSEIDEDQIFNIIKGFDFDITKVQENPNSITYKITVLENITNEDVSYQSIIGLQESENYSQVGNSVLQIIKPIKSDRDKSINTASYFYDTTDPFYRTYGENWLDHNNDGECQWRSFFAFTFPVIVDSNDENAVLGDDMGTDDPSDDIYYHAFQIGFSSSLANRTTNSFNFARWFNNEAVTADVSPGLNVNPALEFYPENGNSSTNGTVLVVPQFITISNREGKAYSFAISGSGIYYETAPGEFEIKLELKVTNDELYGGTVTSQYYIYNNNNYIDPAPISESCVELIDI